MTTSDLSRVQPLLGELALALCNLLSTDLAVVWVTLPGEPVLVPSAWVGFPDDYIGPMRVPYGTGSAGRAVLERRTSSWRTSRPRRTTAPGGTARSSRGSERC
jgi:hypothetical protein